MFTIIAADCLHNQNLLINLAFSFLKGLLPVPSFAYLSNDVWTELEAPAGKPEIYSSLKAPNPVIIFWKTHSHVVVM